MTPEPSASAMPDFFDQLARARAAPEAGSAATSAPVAPASSRVAAQASAPATPRQVKSATQELLRHGLIEAGAKPQLYQSLLTHADAVRTALEPLDLGLRLDEVRGVAFLALAEDFTQPPEPGMAATGSDAADGWTHPLVRRHRLTADQTLLLAILRRHYIAHEQQAGLGAPMPRVALAELWAELSVYLGDSGSDRRDDRRLRDLLQKLREQGAVSDIETDDTVLLRPMLAQLLNPQSLEAVLHELQRMAGSTQEGQADAR